MAVKVSVERVGDKAVACLLSGVVIPAGTAAVKLRTTGWFALTRWVEQTAWQSLADEIDEQFDAESITNHFRRADP